MKNIVLSVFVCVMSAFGTANAAECTNISADEVVAAQKEWGEGIVAIGAAEDHKKAATEHVNKLYNYGYGKVLFKPTKAAEDQFRDNKEEAISYFVGGIVPEDKGFALAPYAKVRFENTGIIIDCDSAMAMGNYYFTGTDGKETKVEYSFGYVRGADRGLKINLHHSSFPYSH